MSNILTAEPGPKALRGILPVIPTLFTVDDRIDQVAQKQVVEFAIQQGASAVVCPAVASEYNFLSLDERKTLVALVSGQVNGRVPIIGGASANTVNDVVAAAHDCQEFGITTLMIMAPRVLGPDIEKQVTFFSEICKKSKRKSQVELELLQVQVGLRLSHMRPPEGPLTQARRQPHHSCLCHQANQHGSATTHVVTRWAA